MPEKIERCICGKEAGLPLGPMMAHTHTKTGGDVYHVECTACGRRGPVFMTEGNDSIRNGCEWRARESWNADRPLRFELWFDGKLMARYATHSEITNRLPTGYTKSRWKTVDRQEA